MNINKLLVRQILQSAHEHKWSFQGLGMFRLYLSSEVRLHLWAPDSAVRDVSTIHTHPWDLNSTVVAGEIVNVRYLDNALFGTKEFKRGKLLCGPGGGLVGEAETVQLKRCKPEVYVEGETYTQKASEIHQSIPMPGTVTIVKRAFGEDRDHAFVFWPGGTEWVSAEPRDVDGWTAQIVADEALKNWF